ncbi:lysozyme C-like [Brachyhypopomus gauderio]|uniref:lysozyme C-like n=1 Tax=Brachyhypopomus gauderio TaxID=698409 RepID=UPI0040424F83
MRTLVLLLLLVLTSARIFERCELARTLKAAGMDVSTNASLADWVCLTKHESNYNTQALNHNRDGSTDYGIFQINNRYWCSDGKFPSHNICKISCADLLTDNISKAIWCAKIIAKQQGIKAWYGWCAHCKDRDVSSYIEGCGVQMKNDGFK